MKNITLEEIIKRKIQYIKSHPDAELRDVDEGYLSGFGDMLNDLDLSETEFTEKYLKAINDHKDVIDLVMDGETAVSDFGRKSGYCNAVSEILGLLNTDFMF